MRKLIITCTSILACAVAFAEMKPLDWSVGYVKLPEGVKATDFYGHPNMISPDGIEKANAPKEFYPAQVPGAVQLDVMKALKMPPFWYGSNTQKNFWMEDCFYTYKTNFKKPDLDKDQRLFFVSKGIDYKFDIFINGQKIHKQEGMFTYVDLDLTDFLKDENELKIFIYPAPKNAAYKEPIREYVETVRDHAARTAKPAVSYGWDWHPRAVPLGIWDETGLELRNASHIKDAYLQYKLSDDFKTANLNLLLEGANLKGTKYSWELVDNDGNVALANSGEIQEDNCEIIQPALNNPRLWWTHDHGEPHLYTWNLKLTKDGKEIQKLSDKIGFRRVKLVMNEGGWIEPRQQPKTRSIAPTQMELNGRRIFVKGSNWVNPEVYYGTIDAKRYDKLVALGKEINFNMFRIWGGAIVNKESFFDACDKYGILVWQEFPLACNNYWDDPYYISTLEQEATSIVKRVRKHPSIGMWSGGNELFNQWSGMTDQSHPLRLLNSVCFKFDRLTPFIATAPLYGMKHGPYNFKKTCGDHTSMTVLRDKGGTTYTEFGVQGMSDANVIREVIPEDEVWPIKPTLSWKTHRCFCNLGWVRQDEVEYYCGKANSLEELVEKSQFLQSQGYKALFEEARRQKPYCAMAMNWDYNDAWKTASGSSLVSYPDLRRPAFHTVKQSCRPFLVSARFDKIDWKPSEIIVADLCLLNDSYQEQDAGEVSVYLEVDGKKRLVGTWNAPKAAPNKNVEGIKVAATLPPTIKSDRFKIILESSKDSDFNSEYGFTVRK